MKSSFLLTLVFLAAFQTSLPGFYRPDRCAFPSLCENHFDNNKATINTWLEAEDKASLVPFRYVQIFEWPTEEEDALHEIRQCHQNKYPFYNWLRPCSIFGSNSCENACWDGGYFRKWNHKYLHFFQHYLQYCSENQGCSCFWSETNLEAVRINERNDSLWNKRSPYCAIKSKSYNRV